MEELLEKIRNNDQSITHLVVTQLSLFYIKVRTNEFEFLTEDKMTLMEALKTNKTITHLVVKDIFSLNFAINLVVEVLKINTTITHLDLSQNVMDFKSIKMLTYALITNKTIVHVNMGRIRAESTVLVSDLLRFNRIITHLDFETNTILLGFIQSIQNNGIIIDLNINGCKLANVVAIQNLLQRNQKMHNRARQCIIQLLCIKKYRQRECLYLNQIDRNVLLMIAKEVWKSRGDFDYWEKKLNKRGVDAKRTRFCL